jgi:glycosyltransferase involved in cell wall biosynthesis
LIEYLAANSRNYDAFIFFTYLYWPTVKGLPVVIDRAILVPLAHDEWTIHLGVFKVLFESAKHFIFNTIEERDFIKGLFPSAGIDGPIAGVAVDRPSDIDPLRFRRQYSIDEGFLLYVGRIDPAKGCDELFEFFQRSRSEGRTPKKLVLLGTPMMTIPEHPDIVKLGFVSTETKWDALAACDVLLMPSVNESLSIVLLEAWSVGKPVVVNGRCAVLVGQCRRANGGLWYSSYEQWVAVIARLGAGRTASVLGRQGWRFVQENYQWAVIERMYKNLVDSLESKSHSSISSL